VSSGFSLVEVLVALVVLQLVILGAMGMMVVASSTMTEAELLERAVSALEGTADSLSQGATPGQAYKDVDGGRVQWIVGPGGEFTMEFTRDERLLARVAGVARLSES
jgi:Tfp pilus assembly protein PilV